MTPVQGIPSLERPQRWYSGVTRAQWLVLIIASAGWIFDSYASQIFNVTRGDLLTELLHKPVGDPSVKFWGEVFLGIYLVGGAIGGTYFGSLSDRIGRQPAMIITILTYTIFCGLTGIAQTAWQVAVFRFIVALGAAGAWVVGASFVAEVFSPQARAQAGAIFHATSNIGTWLASLAGMAIGAQWRIGYYLGAVPILMVFFVKAGAGESGIRKEEKGVPVDKDRGSLIALLSDPLLRRRALLGMLLAAVSLGAYWSLVVGGQDLVQDFLVRKGYTVDAAAAKARFAYGFLINGGGFVGSILFGPFAQKLGRRRAFSVALIGGLLVVPLTWYVPGSFTMMALLLPFYGMFTFGFHSGFAFYFPELFPTKFRATGAGFCFNGGRLLAALLLGLSGWLKSRPGVSLREAAVMLALLYILGWFCIRFLPETKGERLSGEA
jgi:MFS family permease